MCKNRFVSFISGLCLAAASVQAQQIIVANMHSFGGIPDGKSPGSIVMGVDNAIYGVTWRGGDTNLVHDGGYDSKLDGGTIFKVNTDGSGYKVIHTFSGSQTHNSSPSSLIPSGENGISVAAGRDGMIYGTAGYGINGNGMVFRCNSDGNDFSILHAFDSPGGNPLSLIQGRDGTLYGTTISTVFALDTQGSDYRVLHTFNPVDEGAIALGRLLHAADGALYGTTSLNFNGGQGGRVFKITTNGNFTILHTFPDFPDDGIYPLAGLMQGSDGALYGTTYGGGASGDKSGGTVFKLNTDGGGYQILHNFATGDDSSSDGIHPWGELVQGPDGVIYGTTSSGINNDSRGTIFKINPDGTGYNVLYNFPNAAATGSLPFAGLLSGASSDGSLLLYGTGVGGGTFTNGTIFSVLVNAPSLAITPGSIQGPNGQTILYWPTWAYNYTLQTTTNLQSSNWTAVSNALPVSAVLVTNATPAAFFRLMHP